jgi:heat shock protein HslJ
MKSFKLTITILSLILVIVVLAGIYQFISIQKETGLPTDNNVATNYFGNEVSGDLDGDGILDRAFIITEETGGSGTFYYLTALLKTDKKEVSAGKIFLGDRIAPQTTSFENGIITVNFADRKPTDSFVTAPSVGRSLKIAYNRETGQIVDINTTTSTSSPAIGTSTSNTSSNSTVNQTPKPDLTKLKITDHPWTWTKTVYNNDTTVTPRAKDAFVITFMQDGRFSAKTDCNGVGGEYLITENKIVLEKMMSTLMYCDQSQESEFTNMLGEVDNFMFTQYGELVLGIKYDSGSMILR